MKKRTYMILAVIACIGLAAAAPARAQDGDMATVKALMIQAQDDPAPIDRRLEKVEYKLRRVFGFQFYKYVGEGSLSFAGEGAGVIDLPDGHRVQIRIGGKKNRNAEVRWVRDGKPLLSTSVSITRKAPVILGGIPSNGGKLIVVLTRE